MKQFFFFLSLLIVFVSTGFGSSVTKTVGVGQDYTTIADALADINANGLADTVSLMLMDTLYNETSLMYNPSTSQPLSLYMAQGGTAKPHVRVSPGGLPYAIMAVNHAEFVMYNILVEPDVNSTWLAGVNVRSMENNSRVYIQSGGVTGSTTERGYEVLADSSADVDIFGCLVIQVQSVGIYIELQNFPPLTTRYKFQTLNSSVTSGIEIKDCYLSGADTGISVNGIGRTFLSSNTITTQCNVGTTINSMGENSEIRFLGGADTVMGKSIYLPNGHNVSVFEVGSSTLANPMLARRASASMLKLAANSSSLISHAYDITIINDSTVECDFSITNTDFDWVGTAVQLNRKFLGNSEISNNTMSVIGYANLPGMAIKYSSGGIEQATYDDEYNGNIVTHEMGHNWLTIEFQNETGGEVFGGITARGNTISGTPSAMQLKSKRSELPANINNVVVINNTFTGNSIYEGIAFEFGDIDIKTGLRFDSNTVSNTNVAMQYRAKRSELPPNLDGIKTAELSHNMIENVQVGFDFEFNADSSLQAVTRGPIFPPIEIQTNGILAPIAIPSFVAMQYRAKRAEVPPNIESIKITGNTIDGNGGGTAIDLPFTTVNDIEIENNTVTDARYNLLLGSMATEDYIGNSDWYGPPLSIQNNSFTSSVDGALFFQTPTEGLRIDSLNISGNNVNVTGGLHRVSSFFDVFTDLSIKDNNFQVNSFFDVFFDIAISDMGSANIQNNNFSCSGLASSMRGSKYELNIRRANMARSSMKGLTARPDFSVLLGGNSFCDGDVVVDIQNDSLVYSPMNVSINNNQANGNVLITTFDTENEIAGNTFGSPSAFSTSSMPARRYELQVRKSDRVHMMNVGGSLLLNFHNNVLNGFYDVVISVDDTAGIGSVQIDSNTVTAGTMASSTSSLPANRYEVGFRKSKTVTLANSSSSFAEPTSFDYSNNTLTGYEHIGMYVSDETGLLSTALNSNTVDGTSATATLNGDGTSSMPVKKYELAVRAGSRQQFAQSSAVMGNTHTYSNNTITGYEEVFIGIEDSNGTMTAEVNGNTITGQSIVAGTNGMKTSSMAARKYELQVRRSDRVSMSGNNAGKDVSVATGDWFTCEDNTVTGFAEVQLVLEGVDDLMSASIKRNTFTGIGSATGLNTSSMAGNKYQVGVKRSGTNTPRSSSFATAHQWFTYEDNTVSNFSEGGIFDLLNEGEAGLANIEGNTFGNVVVSSNNVKDKDALMAGSKYELNIRRANRATLTGTLSKTSNNFTAADSVKIFNNSFAQLDGGGFYVYSENNAPGEVTTVWLDGNNLSSTSSPFIFDLSEAPFDSGSSQFLVTGNSSNGGTGSSNIEKIRFNFQLGSMYASSTPLSPVSSKPNTFKNGHGLAFYSNPSTPVIFNYQNMTGNSMNIINGTNSQIDARYCWWGTTDSAEIASKMQGDVLFMPFLTDSVTTQSGGIEGVVYHDANFNYTRDSETGLEGWTVNLLVDGTIVDTRVSDANGAYSFMDIPFDQYTVCLVPQDGYAYSENLNCGTVDFSSGTLFSVEFGVFSDAKKFRTFSADTLLSKKPVKMVFKSNIRTSLYPNTATALENVFARLGKNGATFLGIAQLDKNRSKNLAWIPYKKAGDLGKLYTSAHNGTAYPIDSLRPAGKPAKKLKGAVKADRKQFNNRVFEQGIAFNLNIIASALGVTPTGFGELVFDSPGSLLGKKLYGMTLAEIAGWMNQLMTNWDSLGVENSSAYAELGEFANVLKKLNDSFSETVDSSNSSIDTSAVTVGDRNITSGKKNAFAVTLHGVRTASEVGLVKYVPGTVPSVKIQDAGFSEDESTLPTETALMQNYPNPFNPSTNFGFLISDFGVVTLKVYDMLGREVATLLNNDEVEQGEYEINFDASSLTSGVYFYRLTVNGVDDASQSFTDVKRMLLVK